MVPHIRTKDGLSLVLNGNPYFVHQDDPHFADVHKSVKEEWAIDMVLEIFDRVKKKLSSIKDLSPRLSFDGAQILLDDEPLHNYAAERLIVAIESNDPVDPVVNFIERLMHNTSNQVIEHLYRFLEHGKVPLTQDGYFLVYKAVTKDFKDIHSGSFDNHVGVVNEMERRLVDDRRDETCSHGFHVCSFDYLPNFSHADGHVVVCKVDPADVVAIPNDYNDTKMRVSRYEVIAVVDDYYNKRNNVLSDNYFFQVGGVDPVDHKADDDLFGEDDDADNNFFGEDDDDDYAGDIITTQPDTHKDTYDVRVRSYGRLESKVIESIEGYTEAHDFGQTTYRNSDAMAVAVTNQETGEVMYTWGLWTR